MSEMPADISHFLTLIYIFVFVTFGRLLAMQTLFTMQTFLILGLAGFIPFFAMF